MPDIVRPCVLPKGDDVMPRPMSSDRMCSLKAMMACHARPCVLSKGDDGMQRLTSFESVFSPTAVMSCHSQCSLTVCTTQGR